MLPSLLRGLSSVAKASWFRSWLMRPLIEYAGYIPGADDRALPEASDGEAGEDRSPVLLRMVEHLRAGHPLLVFPEASRSHERSSVIRERAARLISSMSSLEESTRSARAMCPTRLASST